MKANHALKILMPVVHYPPVIGGFEVFCENIAERVGVHTSFFVLTGKVDHAPRIEKKEKLSIERSASLWSLHDTSESSYAYILSSLPLLFVKSLKIIRKEGISVLHATGFFNGLVCFLLYKVTGVPYVMTIQSADFTIYHPGRLHKLIASIQAFVERAIYRNASLCHAVSSDLCRHYKNQGVDECVMIPNGVETVLFHPLSSDEVRRVREEYGIQTDLRAIVNVSRLEHKNGVGDVIEAFNLLSKEIDDVVLVIVGDGSLRTELEKQVNRLGVSDKVYFLGQRDRSTVGEIVGSSDVFVRTPLSEGFGIVFLEAMAAEVPVVATPVGGIPDFLQDGKTGIFAKAGDPQDIADAIESLLEDEVLSGQIVSHAKGMVDEEYGWDEIAERVFQLYEGALE